MPAPKAINYEEESIALQSPMLNVGRSLAQGVLFGFGDEAEALVRSAFDKSKSYDEFLEESRKGLEEIRKKAPAVAYGTEIAGGITTGLAGLGRTALAKLGTGARAAAEGAIYGAGATEGDIPERAIGAATGAIAAPVLAKTTEKILPLKSPKARELEKKGVQPTIGQSFRDTPSIGSRLFTAIEEFSTSYPGVGPVIQNERKKALIQTNNNLLNEAIAPLGIKLPKDKVGFEAYDFVDNELDKAYSRVLPKLKISNVSGLTNKMIDNVQESGLSKDSQEYVVKKIVKNISDSSKDNVLSGNKLKNIETEFGRLERQFVPKGGFEGEIGLVFKQLKNQLRDEIELQNPDQNLQKINSVYRNIGPIADAMSQASVKEGVFTPAQLLRALRKADKTKRKKQFLKEQMPLQKSAQLAEDVLGGAFPDSATASRLVAAGVFERPLENIVKLVGPALFADIAYQRPFGISPVMASLQAPGFVARRGAAPVTQSFLPEDYEEKSKSLQDLLEQLQK
jgi:hypothetical protein